MRVEIALANRQSGRGSTLVPSKKYCTPVSAAVILDRRAFCAPRTFMKTNAYITIIVSDTPLVDVAFPIAALPFRTRLS